MTDEDKDDVTTLFMINERLALAAYKAAMEGGDRERIQWMNEHLIPKFSQQVLAECATYLIELANEVINRHLAARK